MLKITVTHFNNIQTCIDINNLTVLLKTYNIIKFTNIQNLHIDLVG